MKHTTTPQDLARHARCVAAEKKPSLAAADVLATLAKGVAPNTTLGERLTDWRDCLRDIEKIDGEMAALKKDRKLAVERAGLSSDHVRTAADLMINPQADVVEATRGAA